MHAAAMSEELCVTCDTSGFSCHAARCGISSRTPALLFYFHFWVRIWVSDRTSENPSDTQRKLSGVFPTSTQYFVITRARDASLCSSDTAYNFIHWNYPFLHRRLHDLAMRKNILDSARFYVLFRWIFFLWCCALELSFIVMLLLWNDGCSSVKCETSIKWLMDVRKEIIWRGHRRTTRAWFRTGYSLQ